MLPITAVAFVALGLFAGILSGLIGIGGGVVIVPLLVYLFGFSQHRAQGTSLALLLPPIGILAAWTYYKQEYIDVKAALLICVGMIIGAWAGAKIGVAMSEVALRRTFGVALLLIAIKMITGR